MFTQNENEEKYSRLKGDMGKKREEIYKYSREYDVDLVFCIDNSENMVDHIDRVKEWIPEIIDRYANKTLLELCGIRNYRASLIVFNDYRLNKEDAILLTDFFDLRTEKSMFLATLNSAKIQPGATDGVCGLEALTYALYSKWSEYYRMRRYIWVFSNSGTSSLEDLEINALHKKGLPKNTKEFLERWRCLENNYAIWFMTPYEKHWDAVVDNLPGCLCFPSAAGEGLKEDKCLYDDCFGSLILGFD